MAKNLLLVDDSVAIREVVALTFETTDLTVRTVAGLEEAWEALQEEPADIVIADADKSQIRGWELCRRLKENPSYRSIPIILFSGDEDEGPRPQDVTPDALLSKPFGSDDLRKVVAALIGLDLSGEEPESEAAEEEAIEPGEPVEPAVPVEAVEPVEPDEPVEPVEEEPPPDLSALDREPETPPPRPEDSDLPEDGVQPLVEKAERPGEPVEDLRPAIESAVRQAVTESLQGLNEEELRRLIASAVRDALKDIVPPITGLVEQVAREVVPELAEIWIEREIQRLKEED